MNFTFHIPHWLIKAVEIGGLVGLGLFIGIAIGIYILCRAMNDISPWR